MASIETLTDEQIDELIASLNTRLGLVDTDPIDHWDY
jgi:hypothetical protein